MTYPAIHKEDITFSVSDLNESFLEVTAVVNPEDHDKYFKQVPISDKCIHIKPGTSLYTIAESGNRDKLLAFL